MALVIIMDAVIAQKVYSPTLQPVSIGGGEYVVSINVLADIKHEAVWPILSNLEQREFEWTDDGEA